MTRLPYPRVSLIGLLIFGGILFGNIAFEAHLQGLITLQHWRLWDREMAFSLYAVTPFVFTDMIGARTVDWHALQSLVTYGFVHISWGHLTFNMIPLAVLGWLSMRRVGSMGFLAIYFGTMVLSALAYVYGATAPTLEFLGAGSPFSRLIGASGAVHGLGGAWVIWAFADRQGSTLHRIWPAALWLGFILAVNGYLYVAMNGGFAWSLHLAGLAFGMMTAPLFTRR